MIFIVKWICVNGYALLKWLILGIWSCILNVCNPGIDVSGGNLRTLPINVEGSEVVAVLDAGYYNKVFAVTDKEHPDWLVVKTSRNPSIPKGSYISKSIATWRWSLHPVQGFFGLLIEVFVFILVWKKLWFYRCSKCKKWFALKTTNVEYRGSTDYHTTEKVCDEHRTAKGQTIGYSYKTVPITKTRRHYTAYLKCKCCGAEFKYSYTRG